MTSVFISYGHGDAAFVRKLRLRISNVPAEVEGSETLEVWYDETGLVPGNPIAQRISEAIRECKIFIFVVSAHSVSAKWTSWELGQALHRSATRDCVIVPLLRDRDSVIPAGLESLRHVDFTEDVRFEESLSELLRVIAPTPIGESVRQSGNHMLISAESPFTKQLRDSLLSQRAALGIDHDPFGEKAQKLTDYKFGLQKFLDDKNSRWLFAVHPEDDIASFQPEEEHQLLMELSKRNKRILFFESGTRFLVAGKRAETLVTRIKTDYGRAVRVLLSYVIPAYLQNMPTVNIVTILGPRCSTADERRVLYNRFLSYLCINHEVSRETKFEPIETDPFWPRVCHGVSPKVLRITCLSVRNWFRNEARDTVAQYCRRMEFVDGYFAFLCGNDDIALGAHDALINEADGNAKRAIDEGRVCFVGFDGIPAMVDALKQELTGVTMRTRLDDMRDKAVEIINDSDWRGSSLIRIPAELVSSPQRAAPKS